MPGSTVESLERTAAAIEEIARGGVTTLCLGGDHTVLLAELRALAAVHGPLALVQLDSHHDLWDEYFGQKVFHGSVVRRAVEEGLIDTARSIQAGLRGSLNHASEAGLPAEFGIEALTYEELAALGPGAVLRAGARTGRRGRRASSRSTSTSSTRRSRPGRGRPRSGGRRAATR